MVVLDAVVEVAVARVRRGIIVGGLLGRGIVRWGLLFGWKGWGFPVVEGGM